MPRKSFIESVIDSFENKDIELTLEQKDYKERLLAIMDLKLNNLYIGDYDLYKSLRKKYKTISFHQVCNDISIVERMIAGTKDSAGDPIKIWNRYFITEVTKKAIALAEEKGDGYTMAYAANILGKHHLTDKEDADKPNWDDIIPFIPKITSDPTILGIKRIKDVDKLRAKLEKKYGYNELKELESAIIDEEAQD